MLDSGEDFVLEISGTGEAITLEPVGTIDLQGARTMLDVLDSLRHDRHGTHLEIRLDRLTGVTPDARRMLSARGVPVGSPVTTGVS
ncbi:MAG TPA: hypothetical protein VGF22_23525 [Acidimicrobiales bacterium]|jgi:hypothetical protein